MSERSWPADRALDTQVREQRQHHRRVTGLAGGEQDGQRAAPSVDRGVDLRAQPAARAAEGVIARFVPAAARILGIRHRPCVLDEHGAILPGTALGRSRMLVRPHDRGVDRHVPRLWRVSADLVGTKGTTKASPIASTHLRVESARSADRTATEPRNPYRLWDWSLWFSRGTLDPLDLNRPLEG